MGNLREKKKRQARTNILSAASDILLSKGYDDTTMEQIAEKAQVGVGTLYNYYKSKAEIFLSVISEELLPSDADNELWADGLEQDLVETIIANLKRYTNSIKRLGKKIYREIFSAMLGSSKPDNLMFKGIVKMDFVLIGKLERLLDAMKNKGAFPQSFKCSEAAHAIYSILFTQTLLYVYINDVPYIEFENNIENQVRFLFEGKFLKS